MKSFAVVRLQVRVGRLGAEAAEIRREVAVKDGDRIPRFGMFGETFRQENIGAQVHRTSPKLAKQFALDPDVPDVFGVFRRRNRSYRLIENDRGRRPFPIGNSKL